MPSSSAGGQGQVGNQQADSPQPRLVAAIVVATVSTVYPGFLIGALSVQVAAEFGVSEARYGWGLGGFFLAATAGSMILGRLVQRIGPRRQIMTALCVTATMQIVIATLASTWTHVVLALLVAGLANAANQTAVNLALTQAKLPRLGLAIAFKQSGMPSASLLSGLMVPILALTFGWRWAYVVGAVLSVVAVFAVKSLVPDPHPARAAERRQPIRPVSTRFDLLVAAAVGSFLAFAAGALNAWLVGSGVDAGLGEGTAGLMLSVGAACGIALRLASGTQVDTMTVRPFLVAGLMVLVGAVGFALLAIRSPGAHVAATLLAFVGGWVWPVFTNYGIVRTNAAAAGSATGITQMGVYIGVFSSPLLTGWIIETYGYSTMWLVVAATVLVGSALSLSVRNRF